MDAFSVDGKAFFVKRDDLLDPRYSGNKLRKLHTLLTTPAGRYDTLVSYGGAQSNAMLSLAYLAKTKGWRFVYHIKRLPAPLREEPMGNFKEALALGMEVAEHPHEGFYDAMARVREGCGEGTLFVPQGGADAVAEAGVAKLAEEVLAWREARGFSALTVATPGGTGTTALFLRKHLPSEVRVVTTPVVGDAAVLKAQWAKLEPREGPRPEILEGFGKWPFAKPHPDFLHIWRRLRDAGILFDLVYAPKMWLELLKSYDRFDGPVLYIHSGGTGGNATQLARYERLAAKERHTL